MLNRAFFAVVLLGFSQVGFAGEQECIDAASTIETKLACLSGVTSQEVLDLEGAGIDPVGIPDGYRVFEIKFTQPVDHQDASLGTFPQRLVLLHRDVSEPMLLQTSGYSIFSVKPAAIAAFFETNQIQVEHRFFSKSKPTNVDWSKLNIKQSADDFHRITVAFKKIYKGRWVNTGASKGGMTSIYHRRFYPNDLDGTVADVAPISFSTNDARYNTFLDQVGGATYATCRANFETLQKKLLEARDELTPLMEGNYTHLGGKDIAFEHAVIESHFIFWQYQHPRDRDLGCRKIPVNGTTKEQFDYLNIVNELDGYTDEKLAGFIPYYFQAATQLGNPANITDHLTALIKYPFNIDQYTPRNVNYTYSNAAMLDVESWVKTAGDEIIFVYGEYDPWTAGEFPGSETGKNVKKYYAPKANHSAKFMALSGQQKFEAIRTLSRWLDKGFVPGPSNSAGKTLEDDEFEMRRKLKLRL